MSIFSGKVRGTLTLTVERVADGDCTVSEVPINFDLIHSPADMQTVYTDALNSAVDDQIEQMAAKLINGRDVVNA